MRGVSIAVLFFALILFSSISSAQDQGLIVSGKITDESGKAVPGANVALKGFDLGAAADLNGAYRFVIPARHLDGNEAEISAAYTGYHTCKEKIVLLSGSVTVNFELNTDVLEMDAVVVTGVEETPKKLLPFTVSRVSNEQAEMVPASSAAAALQGKVAGAVLVKGSGKPGDEISVRLRGANSITGSNAPLYIVDNVILGAGTADIDGLEIESMEVVKGAAGASMYGSRGANGVIRIRTRRGDLLGVGETRIRLRNEFGFNEFVDKKYRSMHHEYKVAVIDDTVQFVDDEGFAVDFAHAVTDGDSGYVIQDNPYPGRTYNHLDQFFNHGSYYSNMMSISQRKGGLNYSLSFGNFKDGGIVTDMGGYNRQHVRLNMDQQVREGLNLSGTVFFSASKRDDPQGARNPFYSLMFMHPNVDLLIPNIDGYQFIIRPDVRSLNYNPLYLIQKMDLDQNRKRMMGAFTLKWAPKDWFNIEANFSYDQCDGLNTIYYPNGFVIVEGQNVSTGYYERYNWVDQSTNGSVTFSFYQSFGNLAAKFKLMAVTERNESENTDADGFNLAVPDVYSLSILQDGISVDSYQATVQTISYCSVLDLDWLQKYILGLSFRTDGNSAFGKNERYQPYFRFSAAWRVSEEPFWFTDKINEFKIRYSYGTAGIRPEFEAQYGTCSVSREGILTKINFRNRNLKPALSIEQEVGLEMAFLDRCHLEVVYAHADTRDQILLSLLPAVYGYEYQWQNAGRMAGSSIEAELKGFILQGRKVSWSAGLAFDRYTQKISKLERPAYATGISQIYKTGSTQIDAFFVQQDGVLGMFYGIEFITSKKDLRADYNPEVFDKNDEGYIVPVGVGNKWKDGIARHLWGGSVNVAQAGEPVIWLPWGLPVKWADPDGGDSKKKIGDIVPDFSLGFNTTLKWGGLTLYALIDAQVAGDIYNSIKQEMYREMRHADCDQAGKKEYEKKPITYYQALYDASSINSHFVEDGSYAKLRELSVQYSFDRTALGRIFWGVLARTFNRITVGVIGRNLFTWTRYSGFDPEVGSGDATLMRIDAFGYPQYRTYTGMIELEF